MTLILLKAGRANAGGGPLPPPDPGLQQIMGTTFQGGALSILASEYSASAKAQAQTIQSLFNQ